MNVEPDDNSLLPARMINEAVYCARLFWLEHVAGECRESHDTLDGRGSTAVWTGRRAEIARRSRAMKSRL